MCVERSKFEPEDIKGQMQASCYSIRFGGSLIGAIVGNIYMYTFYVYICISVYAYAYFYFFICKLLFMI